MKRTVQSGVEESGCGETRTETFRNFGIPFQNGRGIKLDAVKGNRPLVLAVFVVGLPLLRETEVGRYVSVNPVFSETGGEMS